ncbi:hypothetical protein NPIL_48861 [Nephila pilipes]|uniref:Uncharacterized protein n=1 Tax=Nephila pilipes TaxID=299642 RepID=A0A8X6TFW0_NEPPI|nr:hypothetical protein NPIL_48861 [Nephila pilipes]
MLFFVTFFADMRSDDGMKNPSSHAPMRKENKCPCLAHVDAIVVGSLGSWDPSNDAALAQMGVSKKYAKIMRKLICSDTIRWSRDIYIQHLTDKKQY